MCGATLAIQAEMARILVVDDSGVVQSLTSRLELEGHDVCRTESPLRALELLATAHFDAVITERLLPRLDGLALNRATPILGGSEHLPAALAALPHTPAMRPTFDDALGPALDELKAKQSALHRSLGLLSFDRYALDQRAQRLVLSNDGDPRRQLIARVQVVGSVAPSGPDGSSWLWSWANDSIHAAAKARLSEVRDYGQARGWASFTAPRWGASEVDGWEMTAIAVHVLGARGAYCCDTEAGSLFVTLQSADLAS